MISEKLANEIDCTTPITPPPPPQKTPFTILIDNQEKAPYTFTDIAADTKHGGGIYIPSTKTLKLKLADYSIEGYTNHIAIERKSLSDLHKTLKAGREQFTTEHKQLSYTSFSAVIVEANLKDIVDNKRIYRTVLSWSVTSHVPWFFCESRRFAETTTFWILMRAWQKLQMTHPFVLDE